MRRKNTACGVCAALLLTFPAARATTVVFDQSGYNRNADFRNSNTLTNGNTVTGTGSTQQIADDFMVTDPDLQIVQVNLWFVYQFGTPSPMSQPLVLNIWDDLAGRPGAIVYEATVEILPVSTGAFNSFFDASTQLVQAREIYLAEVILPTPFLPEAGARYWLNPMGDDDEVTWGWQFSDTTSGQRYSRHGNAVNPEVWRPFAGDFAFALIAPEPSGALLLAAGCLAFGLRRSRR